MLPAISARPVRRLPSQSIRAAPSAPTIASFSTDTGTAGDRITNDNTLTLTGSAQANSTVKVYDGATLLGAAHRQRQRSLELHHGGIDELAPTA